MRLRTIVRSRELDGILRRANLGRYVEAVIEQRELDGLEKELQEHYNLAGNQVPMSALRVEHRAVTPSPGDVGRNADPIIPAVFPQSRSQFLRRQHSDRPGWREGLHDVGHERDRSHTGRERQRRRNYRQLSPQTF